jgi:addiction module HigA family antidote
MAMRTEMKNPPHPGCLIRREVLEPLGLPISRAAAILGIGRGALTSLVNGRTPLTFEMALRIEKAFGPRMDHLMRMQYAYDFARTRRNAAAIRVGRYRSAA